MSSKRRRSPSNEVEPRLEVRPFPSDLLERLNALAALLGMDRNKFVIEFLEQETARLEEIQNDVKQWWQSRPRTTKD